MKILVTGSSGLIGGAAVEYFDSLGHTVIGLDNNQRKEFFGEAGDTSWNLHRIAHKTKNFTHMPVDICNEGQLYDVFCKDPRVKKNYQGPFDAIIHCAAQPSHDKAREIPLVDFNVNAKGTMLLLEMTRQHSPDAVFIYMSTNKVYGDSPNDYLRVEHSTRYDYVSSVLGIDETCNIDQSTHSIFGANKLAADIMVQEYGRSFGLKTCVFRGGCLTGPGHSGVELHGFLSYMVRTAVSDKPYKVYGYKGKQVRDNIHSDDVVRAFEEVIKNPKSGGQVYNLGGGRDNSISVLEAIEKIEHKIHKKINWEYVDQARLGDHICYISDISKFKRHYPNWKITKTLDQTLDEMIKSCNQDLYSEHEDVKKYDLNENSVVFDIGGYRGAWTEDIFNRYNSNIHVFEPTKEFYDECRFRFENNPKVTVHCFGLSDSTRAVKLAKQGMNTSAFRGMDGFQSMPTDRIFGEPVFEDVTFVDVVDVIGDTEIDLASINCEGGEFPLLHRLISTGKILQFKNVQIQFHNFYPNAVEERDVIRESLAKTHRERFCYPFIWESWERK